MESKKCFICHNEFENRDATIAHISSRHDDFLGTELYKTWKKNTEPSSVKAPVKEAQVKSTKTAKATTAKTTKSTK